MVYFYDILIYSRDHEVHVENLREVFEVLRREIVWQSQEVSILPRSSHLSRIYDFSMELKLIRKR